MLAHRAGSLDPMLARLRVLLVALCSSAVVLGAGCGGDDSGAGGGSGAEALAHLPKDSPVTLLVQTDPGSAQVKDALALVRRFPGGDALLERLEDEVAGDGRDYSRDIKPLLGNPLAIGAVDASADDFVGAVRVDDVDALQRAVEAGDAVLEAQVGGGVGHGQVVEPVDRNRVGGLGHRHGNQSSE